ncbi:MAG: exodeoxyribonuclease VII small subunit [Eubacteriales bacterium]
MDTENQTFESALGRLEQIVGSLNNGRAPLAEALELFEEGAGLLAYCSKSLDDAEAKVNLLSNTGENGSPEVQEFTQEEKES